MGSYIFTTGNRDQGLLRMLLVLGSFLLIIIYPLSGQQADPSLLISWEYPGSAETVSDQSVIAIKARITSQYKLKEIKVTVNNENIPYDRQDLVPNSDNVSYSFQKNIQLNPGRNVIFITADNTRRIANSSKRVINCTYDPVPAVTLVNPSVNDSLNSTGAVLVEAEIISHSMLQSYRILHNGKEIGNGTEERAKKRDSVTYVIEKEVNLQSGSNTFMVEAKNAKGKGVSEKRTIKFLSDLLIRWISPSSVYNSVTSENIIVKAEIKSAFELQSALINMNGTELAGEKGEITRINNDTYSFTKQISLSPGKNDLFITAVNKTGAKNSTSVFVGSMLPVVSIINPVISDSVSTSGSVLISAEITSVPLLQSVRIFINGKLLTGKTIVNPPKKDKNTYIIEKQLPLEAGPNTIYVEAKNSIGTSGSEKRNVIWKVEPMVIWTFPRSVISASNTGSAEIKAEIKTKFDLREVLLKLNGKMLPESGVITRIDNDTYRYENTINLVRGENIISLNAGNARGIGISDELIVTYSPGIISEIKWINPVTQNSNTYKPELIVYANIKSKSEIKNLQLFLNGVELRSAGVLKKNEKNPQEFNFEKEVILTPGINTVELSAFTNEGTVESEKYVINYIVPALPVLSWKNSSDQAELTQPSIEIMMDIKSDAILEDIKVYLNNIALENIKISNSIRKENEKYLLSCSIIPYSGDNTIYVSATNAAGTAKSDSRSFKYVMPSLPVIAGNTAGNSTSETRVVNNSIPSSPLITWISPSRPNNDINQNSAKIKVKVKSFEKPQPLFVYVNGRASEAAELIPVENIQDEFIMEKSVNLQPGENNIYIVASNTNGTSKSEIRYLTNPPTNPPVISWTVPVDQKAIVNSEIISIGACIKSATELKSLQIFVNGVQQASDMVFQEPQSGDCNYMINKQVILKEGDNSVFLIASNFAGSTNSDRRLIRFETKLIAEKRLALVIGNSDYGSSNNLKNPANDANLIESTLKDLGFEVIKRLNATKNEMMESLRDFSKRLPEYNVALFYYAGHGIQVDGQNYLIPVDAILKEKTDCKWEAMPVNYVVEEFERVPENINIVILDACRNNPYRSWVRGGEEGFRAVNPVSGTIISFATSEGSTAADGSGLNGPYTEELVKQMNVSQSVSNVFINTRREVMRRTNNTQRPQEWNMLTGDFFFKK